MSNHPNRRVPTPGRAPTAAQVRAARKAAGLSQTQAAALLWTTLRHWQQWEYEGDNPVVGRKMHPALFDLLRLLTKQATVAQVRKERP